MRANWLRTLLDTLLPPRGDVVVARTITEEELGKLMHPHTAGETWIVSLFPYRDARIRALIKSIKFYGETAPLPHAGRIAGEYVLDVVSDKKLFAGWNTPLLIPMPISKERLQERGYNQVERFAEGMLPFIESAVRYAPNVLSRTDRKSQIRMERAARPQNIHGAFFVSHREAVSGRHVILLDDVVESGATMKDARRALLESGAAGVIGIAIAN